jgi:site-specific recombinase XerC
VKNGLNLNLVPGSEKIRHSFATHCLLSEMYLIQTTFRETARLLLSCN